MKKNLEKTYGLYKDNKQSEYYACANTLNEIKEVSSEYLSGVWFVYDVEKRDGHIDTLLNEKQYKGKVTFAKELKIKKTEEELEEEKYVLRDSIGDLR